MKITKNQTAKSNFKSIFSFAFLALFLVFQSCSKDDVIEPETPDTTTPSQEQYVKCKIDGVDFLSKDDALFNHAKIITLGGLTVHQLRGANTETEAIVLGLYGFNGVGVYNINDPDVITGAQWLTVNPYATYDCNQAKAIAGTTSGKIEVTFHSAEKIEGTFEFTAENTGNPGEIVTITDGEFRLNY